MKQKSYDFLTWAAISNYGDRKEPGRFSVVVDLPAGTVYAVPREVEHKDFLCTLLGRTEEEIKQNPSMVKRIVPVHIDLNGQDEVYRIITGLSGFEQIYRVKHSIEDLQAAHQRALKFVEQGEAPCVQTLEAKIDGRYARLTA